MENCTEASVDRACVNGIAGDWWTLILILLIMIGFLIFLVVCAYFCRKNKSQPFTVCGMSLNVDQCKRKKPTQIRRLGDPEQITTADLDLDLLSNGSKDAGVNMDSELYSEDGKVNKN